MGLSDLLPDDSVSKSYKDRSWMGEQKQDKQLSDKVIADKLNTTEGTVRKWRNEFDIQPVDTQTSFCDHIYESSAEKAYIIGCLVGDGHINKENYSIKLSVIDEEFRDEFQISLSSFIRKNRDKISTGIDESHTSDQYYCILHGKELVDHIMKYVSEWRSWIEEFNKRQKLFLCRGLWDSEGSVTEKGTIRFHNTDEELINLYEHCLTETTAIPSDGITRSRQEGLITLYLEKQYNRWFYINVSPTIQRKNEKIKATVIG